MNIPLSVPARTHARTQTRTEIRLLYSYRQCWRILSSWVWSRLAWWKFRDPLPEKQAPPTHGSDRFFQTEDMFVPKQPAHVSDSIAHRQLARIHRIHFTLRACQWNTLRHHFKDNTKYSGLSIVFGLYEYGVWYKVLKVSSQEPGI